MFSREIESSVQMRLYTMSKRTFVLVFIVFFICFGMSLFIGCLGPPITQARYANASQSEPPPASVASGPFHMRPGPLTLFHQQLWVISTFRVGESLSDRKLEFAFTVSLNLTGLDHRGRVVFSSGPHTRLRHLRCDKRSCSPLLLLHLNFINSTRYRLSLHFNGLQNVSRELLDLRDLQFTYKTYNPAFTQIEIWFRFLFLTCSFAAVCLFMHSLRRFLIRDWSIEQRWMAVLLPLLLLYNDPILPLTFLTNSWLPGLLDAVFQATFLSSLLMFWLCIYHSVRQNERHFCRFYLPKLLIVACLWLFAVAISAWQVAHELTDPTYFYKLDAGNFLGLKATFLSVCVLYVLYLLYLVVRAYAELRTMPYFDLRLKFSTLLMLIVIGVSVAITALRFGSQLLDDNFVAEVSAQYTNSVEFLAFYGMLNFYLYTMAYVYSPSKNAAYETHFKDDPGISMVNDSDEEVLYDLQMDFPSCAAARRKI